MAIEAIRALKIDCIEYESSYDLNILTFVFSGGVRCPPAKTYSDEPSER